MTTVRSILFVSPWPGIIGPNVGLAQLVTEAGGRGIEAHVACPARDGAAEAMEQQGATLHVMDEIALTPRSMSPVALVGLAARLSWAADEHPGAYLAEQEYEGDPEELPGGAETDPPAHETPGAAPRWSEPLSLLAGRPR